MSANICTVADCQKPYVARGLCGMHYQRAASAGTLDNAPRRHYIGDPEGAFKARTEWNGDCLLWTGATSSAGYGMLNIRGRRHMAHRYAWERVHGPIPEGMLIDHKHHCDPACVNVEHLRLATRSQNNSNKRGPRRNNKSTGVRNVYPTRNKRKFKVMVGHQGEQHWGGVFNTVEDATKAARALRTELFGAYAGKG